MAAGLHSDEVNHNWRQDNPPFVLDMSAFYNEPWQERDEARILERTVREVEAGIQRFDYIVHLGGEDHFTLMVHNEDGEIIGEVPLRLTDHPLDSMDLKGEGRSVEIGDLFKLVRASRYFRELVHKEYVRCTENDANSII